MCRVPPLHQAKHLPCNDIGSVRHQLDPSAWIRVNMKASTGRSLSTHAFIPCGRASMWEHTWRDVLPYIVIVCCPSAKVSIHAHYPCRCRSNSGGASALLRGPSPITRSGRGSWSFGSIDTEGISYSCRSIVACVRDTSRILDLIVTNGKFTHRHRA